MTDQKTDNISSIPIDGFSNLRITSIWTFLMSVQWSERWLIGLLLFHVVCLFLTVVTCRFYRAQICHFLIIVGLVYTAEYLNELAAMNWRSFSNFQYFDSKGMFISLVYSIPLLLNAVIIVMVWVYRTFSTMAELKTLQLKRRARREKREKTDWSLSLCPYMASPGGTQHLSPANPEFWKRKTHSFFCTEKWLHSFTMETSIFF